MCQCGMMVCVKVDVSMWSDGGCKVNVSMWSDVYMVDVSMWSDGGCKVNVSMWSDDGCKVDV